MDEFYNPKQEYYDAMSRLAHDNYGGDFGGLDRAHDREIIDRYEEAESWNNMGGS